MHSFRLLLSLVLLSVIGSSKALPCRLELQLDHEPDDIAWELRGPLPQVKLIAKVDYDHYDHDMYSRLSVTENFDLEEGKSYYFLITDYAQNGINEGHLKLLAQLPSGDVILEEGKGEEIGHGKAFNFVVPIIPKSQQVSTE